MGEKLICNNKKAFELRWAITLLEQVYRRLEEEHRQQGKAELFDAMRTTLAGPGNSAPYVELAARLGMNEGAVKVAVHRLRQRYRALLRETIAETVAGPEEVEDEMRYLLQLYPDLFTPADVLEMGTLGGARAIGRGEEAGSLEPGKRADFVLVEPLQEPFTADLPEQILYNSRVSGVWSGGEVAVRVA